MRYFAVLLAALAGLAALLSFSSLSGGETISSKLAGSSEIAIPINPSMANTPVVFELFTSQGCSSCPPADRVAAKLAEDPNYIVISRPVTYWDRLGWKDTLAREANTDLQRNYAQRGIEDQGVYTPQAVLDGRKGVVASQETDIRAIAAKLPAKSDAAIETMRDRDGSFMVGLGGSTSEPAELMLLEIIPQVKVAIGSGENGGNSLGYANVVRSETRLTNWDGGTQALTISPGDLAPSTPQSGQPMRSGQMRHLLLLRLPDGGPILAANWLQAEI